MVDRFGRSITYLRISVTDRCNLRCRYCMPAEGVPFLSHDKILSYEMIVSVARAAVDVGVSKIRLTGGEPLVRRDIESLVGMLAQIDGVEELAMTTNGILLAHHAQQLADAGLQRVNVSLDATDPDHYRHITRVGDVSMVFEGIAAAKRAGLTPIKINCVVKDSADEPDARDVTRFAEENGLQIRYIKEMDFETGTFSIVQGGSGGDCEHCNRLRLSSDGLIRPCLFSEIGFSVRELGAVQALEQAVINKPESGMPCHNNRMNGIGG